MLDAADLRFMRGAIALARRGVGRASPNPPVGCAVVRDGVIVGRGWHEYARRDHAEVVALKEAGARARGATAYVTLEPCSHQGRTGPCADALIRAGIGRVVVGTPDPSPRVFGRGAARLRKAGIEVEVGACEREALRLIETFACHAVVGRPLVAAKVAMSLDGRIATASGDSRWITSPAGRKFGQRLRRELDAILVGVGTVLADDPELTYRGRIERGRPLLRVVLDGRLRTPPEARMLRTAREVPVLLFCRPGTPAARRRRLEQTGAETVAVPGGPQGLDLIAVLAELARRGVLGLLVEGGSAVHGSFVAQSLVDKIFFIVAPLVLGGTRSVAAIGGEGFPTVAEAPRFAIARELHAGSDCIFEVYPDYSRSIAAPQRLRAVPPSASPGRYRA